MRDSEDIKTLFSRVKELNNYQKMKLKRLYGDNVQDLAVQEYGIFWHLFTGLDGMRKLSNTEQNFLLNMVSLYIQQDCTGGKNFEDMLGEMYREGNNGTKESISYFVSEYGRDFIADMERYIDMFSSKNNINVIKLTCDTLNWNAVTKRMWRRNILKLRDEKEGEEHE